MPDFSRRAALAEWMDDPATDYATFRACLTDLARVNRLTLAYPPTLAFLDRVVRAGLVPRARPLAILDAGSGDGDMLRAIDRWAARRGVAVALTGVDLSPWSARAAAEATAPGRPIAWVTADLFAYRPAVPPDLVISALFTHHLDDRALVRFLGWMEATAKCGWFVNDLHRHPVPYHFFAAATKALGFHPFVIHDGPISIARAFTFADWRQSLAAAGIARQTARLRWHFPFRITVERLKRV